jgi:hypothetical protein
MISHSKGVDSSPETPFTPLSNMRLSLPSDDENDEIRALSGHDGVSAFIRAVADPGENEDDE